MTNETLAGLAETCAEAHGAHMIDARIWSHRGRTSIEVFIDAERGVTSDLCSSVSRELAKNLDTQDVMKGSYTLVVSSPGIDRPLKYPWQYKKHIGRTLAVQYVKDEESVRLRGVLEEVDEQAVTLVLKPSGEKQRLEFAAIREALVLAPW